MASRESAVDLPFHLKGNYEPVREELTTFDLPVDGAIPPSLRGLYLRNGPNRVSGVSPHWFVGDGMVHGVRVENGKAAWYRNRWVRTRPFEDPSAQFVRSDGTVDRSVAVANTNVIGHAGRIFALVETSFPTELTPELDTLGICDFDGRLETAMTAHPKCCPVTGELHFFGCGFAPPYLTYHRLDAAGELVHSQEIDVPGPAMVHDFAITRRNVVFMDLPIVFSPELAVQGRFPYRWSDAYGARLGVMPREAGAGGPAPVQWLDIEPCYVFHALNAFDSDDGVVLEVARYTELWREGPESFTAATLHRFAIDLAAREVVERALDDRPIELPRVDDRRTGLEHRYGYALSGASSVLDPRCLVKYDLGPRAGARAAASRTEVHDFGPGFAPGEAAFVPASEAAGEDEGFVLAFVYDQARNGSDLVILDARAFGGPPVATIRLPQRVPFGFHGNWIPDAP
ncbi:MAG: carotenoid oxygenase family protein [Deltaproteobacteria bacterium]|nr:MAG: carotenoid oxygenase family protein [Deltaproteobacteria bacterium]